MAIPIAMRKIATTTVTADNVASIPAMLPRARGSGSGGSGGC